MPTGVPAVGPGFPASTCTAGRLVLLPASPLLTTGRLLPALDAAGGGCSSGAGTRAVVAASHAASIMREGARRLLALDHLTRTLHSSAPRRRPAPTPRGCR
eukprot:9038288-Alexandrium_andersonii.AAC.1